MFYFAGKFLFLNCSANKRRRSVRI